MNSRRTTRFAAAAVSIGGLALLSAAILLGGSVTARADTHFVSPRGNAAPERDQPGRPWQLVEAAARSLPPQGGTVSIAPGTYREGFTLDTPMRLVAPAGGVTIGRFPASPADRTTFNVFTLNTHLFGDVVGPSWFDYARAEQIGRRMDLYRDRIDLVAFNEIWDEDLFWGGDGAVGIFPLSGYPRAMHGSATAVGEFVNSGLALMSRNPWSETIQVSFDDCFGIVECASNKGYLAATVTKDGFTLRIFSTHTQAGDAPLDGDGEVNLPRAARLGQIAQLVEDLADYRIAHPSHVILLMGDLNVPGEGEEYETLRQWMDLIGGLDAARNAPVFSIYHHPELGHTLTSYNELAIHFDDTPYNDRLDYVWYFPSLDGSVVTQPRFVERILFRNVAPLSDDDLTSDELSDHYPLNADFDLFRVP